MGQPALRTLPRLTDEIIADAGMLMIRLEELVHDDARATRYAREIVRHQGRLQGLVGIEHEDVWASYLAVEELTNARAAHLMIVIATWAYQEGRRNT